MNVRVITPGSLALAAALALPSLALAAPASGEAKGSVELGSKRKAKADGKADANAEADAKTKADAKTEANTDAAKQRPWIRRYTPRRNMWEVGLFGGVWLPADNIELRDRNLGPVRYDLSADLGLRVAYYPLRHFGLEGELAMMPTRLETEQRAFVTNARAHIVLQLGFWRLVPFAVLGGGVLSVRSEPNAAGRNGDEELHVGGGLKYFVNDHIALRLEGRDIMSPKEGITPAAPAHSPEILLGFTIALGPRKPKEEPPPPDQDGDGFLDAEDACPIDAGIAPDGCPAKDSDGDSFLDREDSCPQQAGVAPDGCPIPDSDGDGYLDPDDACPTEVGVEPDGCPLRDVDGDGIFPPQDLCPEEPETLNGFDDEDGCPDDLPEEVKKYTGVIEGIFFDTGKATIRSKSFAELDAAVKVLTDYPTLRVEISGHTDSKGKRDKNLQLSQDRANSVKQYLASKGVAEQRIVTRGAGPDEPVGDNKTKSGRQQNRRIEFKLLTTKAGDSSGAADAAATDEAEAEGAASAEAEATAEPKAGGKKLEARKKAKAKAKADEAPAPE